MNEFKMEKVLKALSDKVPKASEKTVEDMVKTVAALNAERARRMGVTVEQLNKSRNKDLTQRVEKKYGDPKKTM